MFDFQHVCDTLALMQKPAGDITAAPSTITTVSVSSWWAQTLTGYLWLYKQQGDVVLAQRSETLQDVWTHHFNNFDPKADFIQIVWWHHEPGVFWVRRRRRGVNLTRHDEAAERHQSYSDRITPTLDRRTSSSTSSRPGQPQEQNYNIIAKHCKYMQKSPAKIQSDY